MKLCPESTEEGYSRYEDRVPKVPTYRKWGAIWGTMDNARKDGQYEIFQSQNSEGNGDDGGDRLVSREKEYY